jgi:hypothetical protein
MARVIAQNRSGAGLHAGILFRAFCLRRLQGKALIQLQFGAFRWISIGKRRSVRYPASSPIRIPGDWPTPKEQSAFFCRNDSESEMSSLPAQSHFGTLQRLLFALVEHGFVVCLSCAEQVVDDSGKLVSCSCNSLRFPELAANPAEELSHVVFGMM